MKKERNVILNAHEVKAVLESRQTQLRRPLSRQPHPKCNKVTLGLDGIWRFSRPTARGLNVMHGEDEFHSPYGQVGDRLWVREAWSPVNRCGEPAIAYKADRHVFGLMGDESFLLEDDRSFNYDDPRVKGMQFSTWSDDLLSGKEGKWLRSIHMPKWVSRLLLEVIEVRAERLQSISREDAVRQGIVQLPASGRYAIRQGDQYFGMATHNPLTVFEWLWDEMYGEDSWGSNPWVWAVKFKVVEVRYK